MVTVTDSGRSRFWIWIGLIFLILLLLIPSVLLEIVAVAERHCYELKYQEMVHEVRTNNRSTMDAGKHMTGCSTSSTMATRVKVEFYIVRFIMVNLLCSLMLAILIDIQTQTYQFKKTRFNTRPELKYQHPALLTLACLAGLGCPIFAVISMDTWGEDLVVKMADMKLDWLLVAIVLVFVMIVFMLEKCNPKADASNQVSTEDCNGFIAIRVDPKPDPMLVEDALLKLKTKMTEDKIPFVV